MKLVSFRAQDGVHHGLLRPDGQRLVDLGPGDLHALIEAGAAGM